MTKISKAAMNRIEKSRLTKEKGKPLPTLSDLKQLFGVKVVMNDALKMLNLNSNTKYNRKPCYYWVDAKNSRRVGWNFPSVQAAKEWRDLECRRYALYNSLEDYLSDVLRTKKDREIEYWKKDREKFLSWRLRRGVFDMEPKYFWEYEVDKEGNLIDLSVVR